MAKAQNKKASRVSWRKLFWGATWSVVVVGSFFLGRNLTGLRATAQTPGYGRPSVAGAKPQTDYNKRVVAYLYGRKMPVTRQELGEYLIQRYGSRSLDLLINRKIVLHEAARRGITITDQEVEAALIASLRGMGIDDPDPEVAKKRFVQGVLKRYKKTLYEWKEDVVRPRLMLEKLSKGRVTVKEDEIQKAYQSIYGPKVKCQLIFWPARERDQVYPIWEKISKNRDEFDRHARKCFIPSVASRAGVMEPIGRHSTGDPELERVLFGLKEGEVSQIIETGSGESKMLMVAKCIEHYPASTIKFEQVRAKLENDVYEKKVASAVGATFLKLREEAHPELLLEKFNPDDNKIILRSRIPGAEEASEKQKAKAAAEGTSVKPAPGK